MEKRLCGMAEDTDCKFVTPTKTPNEYDVDYLIEQINKSMALLNHFH